MKTITAAILVIGNEILSGRTQDTNIHFLARRLNELNLRVMEARVVSDAEEDIVAAVTALKNRYNYVFTTGGIGPTHDDITADCIAKAFGVSLKVREDAHAILLAHYGPEQLNEARLRMARIPDGASLIPNPVSAAPGFRIGNVFVMAGVPRIMQAMFEGIKDQLIGGPKLHARALNLNLPEGSIASPLAAFQLTHPLLEIGSYPYVRNGALGTVIVFRGYDPDILDDAVQAWAAIVVQLGGVAQPSPAA